MDFLTAHAPLLWTLLGIVVVLPLLAVIADSSTASADLKRLSQR